MAINTTVRDSLTRDDEDPLSQNGNWTNYTGLAFKLSGNKAVGEAANAIALYSGTPGGASADHDAWCELGTVVPNVNNAVYALARGSFSAGPHYSGYAMMWVYTGVSQQVQLRKIVNDVETPLAFDDPHTLTTGDAVGIHVVGTTIEGWCRVGGVWTMILTTTDATIASGLPGMISVSSMPIRVFGGGDPGPSPSFPGESPRSLPGVGVPFGF